MPLNIGRGQIEEEGNNPVAYGYWGLIEGDKNGRQKREADKKIRILRKQETTETDE